LSIGVLHKPCLLVQCNGSFIRSTDMQTDVCYVGCQFRAELMAHIQKPGRDSRPAEHCALKRTQMHHERILVSFGVDLLCGAAVGSRQLSLQFVCVLTSLVPCFDLQLSLVTQMHLQGVGPVSGGVHSCFLIMIHLFLKVCFIAMYALRFNSHTRRPCACSSDMCMQSQIFLFTQECGGKQVVQDKL
jgi:hypothetical protein